MEGLVRVPCVQQESWDLNTDLSGLKALGLHQPSPLLCSARGLIFPY